MIEYTVKVFENRTEWYNKNGKLHREDGPAIEYTDGSKYWYLNGKLHREDGPAIECANGAKRWYINGFLHREDGPAVEYTNGRTEYWINDNHIPQLDDKKIYGKDIIAKLIILL